MKVYFSADQVSSVVKVIGQSSRSQDEMFRYGCSRLESESKVGKTSCL